MFSSIKLKLIVSFLLVLALSVGVISYTGFRFFLADKEKYVYAIESQQAKSMAAELASKVTSYRRMLLIFGETLSYRFRSKNDRERAISDLSKKYNDFLFVGLYQREVNNFAHKLSIKMPGLFNNLNLNKINLPKLFQLSKNRGSFFVLNVGKFLKRPSVALVQYSGQRVVIGILPAARILEPIPKERRVFTAFVINQSGQLVLHMDKNKSLAAANFSNHPIVKSYLGKKAVGAATMEYLKGQTKIISSLSPIKGSKLWLVLEIPASAAFSAAKQLIEQLWYLVLIVFIISITIAVFISGKISRPLRKLALLTRKVSQGNFGVTLKTKGKDEVGQLVKSFNTMSSGLKEREQLLDEKNKQLLQSEKMGAFGQMSAGIAHEVKNPLAGILGYAQLAKRKIDPGNTIVIKNLEIIEKETKRCKEIIENLMKFARAEKTTMEDVETEQVVKDSVALVDHQISLAGIKIVRDYAPEGTLAKFWGSGNQVQQVLTNLMLNASHAMEGGGTLTVTTAMEEAGRVVIKVADTGTGIKKEHLEKIFEPFFTTKAAGKGTGLGLAVSYGIIRDHRGELKVDSEIGKGTTFTIILPTKVYLEQQGQL